MELRTICEMKEMVYGGEECLLYAGWYGEYQIAILSLRSHPCGYIRIPDKKLERVELDLDPDGYDDYDNWSAEVHYGLTYGKFGKPGRYEELDDGFWLGWDYAHIDDYTGLRMQDGTILLRDEHGKKWTTEEILEEAINGIKSLRFYYSIREEHEMHMWDSD